MPSQLIETIGLNTDVQIGDDVRQIDDAYLSVATVTYLTSELLQAIGYPEEAPASGVELRDAVEESASACEFADDREEYIEELEATFECGRDIVLDVDDSAPLKRDFAANIDEDDLRELRGTVGYVGGHLGVDVTLPTLEEVREA